MTKFIHISDPHLSTDYNGLDIMRLCKKTGLTLTEQFERNMAAIRKEHPDVDFYLLSGDIVQDGTAGEYAQFREYINRLMDCKPCYATVGNHDSAEFWQGWFGTGSRDTFDYTMADEKSGLTIVALDSRGGPYGSGILSDSQLKWLSEQLSTGLPSIIILHHTPHTGEDEYLKYQMQNSREFYDAVRGGNVLGVFSGHTHIRFESVLGDIPCHTAPSITFGLIVEGHSMTATDTTGYNYCEYSDGVITVTNIDIPGTGAMAGFDD